MLTSAQYKVAEKKYMEEDRPIYTLEVKLCDMQTVWFTQYMQCSCAAAFTNVFLQAHRYYFDPTMRPNGVGKYINHAAKGANLKLFPPIKARGKLRIGFVSIREIHIGDELFFDYGFR